MVVISGRIMLSTGSILDFSIDSLAKIKLFARYMGWCLGACGAASLRNDESCCYKHCQICIFSSFMLKIWEHLNMYTSFTRQLVTTIPYYQWWRVFFGPAYLFWHIKSLFWIVSILNLWYWQNVFSSLYVQVINNFFLHANYPS